MRVLAAAYLVSLAACTTEDADAPAAADVATATPDSTAAVTTALTYYKDVKPIVDVACTRCHSTGNIMERTPLTSFDEVAPLRALIKEKVTKRLMPPWLATTGCAEYKFDVSLSESEIATLSEWADGGGPAGDPSTEPKAVALEVPSLSRVDVTLAMKLPYTPQIEPDDYRCFLMDWPSDHDVYITGFGAKPGNVAVVHHVIAYQVPPDKAAAFQAFDDAEDGPGYTCFGGPQGKGGDAVGGNARWLGAWAPGAMGSDFTAGTGIKMKKGSKVALQVHYNTLGGVSPDQTSVVFKVDDAVEHEAVLLPFADIQWVTSGTMDIPAGDPDATHGFASDVASAWMGGAEFTIHTASLHMHVLGTRANLYIERADGTKDCLLDIPRWDFHWQRSYVLQEPRKFKVGDKLGIECHWDNSQANQPMVDGKQRTAQDVNWGEGTTDEMCLGVFYLTF